MNTHNNLNINAIALLSLGLLAIAPMAVAKKIAPLPNTTKASAITPGSNYRPSVETLIDSLHFRANLAGITPNQAHALDKVASRADWTLGNPVSLVIVSNNSPQAIATAETFRRYLLTHGVADTDLSLQNDDNQPQDILSLNILSYRTKVITCGENWENLSATRNNVASNNYGCALAANTAAMIADPRDLDTPSTRDFGSAARRDTIMQNYQKGKITSSEVNQASSAKISEAIK